MDRFQRRRTFLAVPVAVFKKLGDDHGGHWAALVTYYGFVSLFPLLLALATILSFVVQGDERLQERILESALSQFPIIGDEIRDNLGALRGSSLALAIGLIGVLWAGMGVILTLQEAMDDLWNVPRLARRGFAGKRLRALLSLAGLGLAVAASAALATLGTSRGELGPLRVLSLLGTLALNVAVVGSAFRYLTAAVVGWRAVLPGAVLAGVAWMVLLALGSWLVDRQLRDAGALYGFFAIVLGLLSWIYLGAQMLLMSAELNVVLARRLWPRGLSPPLTAADRAVLAARARQEQRQEMRDIHVHFPDERLPPDPSG
ncbi:MAG TPA: YihY/virulence factor BrkB family protein [Actinomycetota bacterium]